MERAAPPRFVPMYCVGAVEGRFRVVAGPDRCVDRPESVTEFRSEAARAGITTVGVQASSGTRFTFEVEAPSPESACEIVTTLLRSVYGLNWWADVTALCPSESALARAAAWN
jgi:hypothetical protein